MYPHVKLLNFLKTFSIAMEIQDMYMENEQEEAEHDENVGIEDMHYIFSVVGKLQIKHVHSIESESDVLH